MKAKEERVKLVPDRIKYWLSVGAQPSEHVAVLLKKYMAKWEQKVAEGQSAQAPPPAGGEPTPVPSGA